VPGVQAIFIVVVALVGFCTRRWIALVLPFVGYPLYGIGLDRGWWGCCGTGEAWPVGIAGFTVGLLAATAVAVLTGRYLVRRLGPPPWR
jgi:hypothetical protein